MERFSTPSDLPRVRDTYPSGRTLCRIGRPRMSLMLAPTAAPRSFFCSFLRFIAQAPSRDREQVSVCERAQSRHDGGTGDCALGGEDGDRERGIDWTDRPSTFETDSFEAEWPRCLASPASGASNALLPLDACVLLLRVQPTPLPCDPGTCVRPPVRSRVWTSHLSLCYDRAPVSRCSSCARRSWRRRSAAFVPSRRVLL